MANLSNKTAYEVEVSREYFDLDKESVTEAVFKTDSVRKAFEKVAKVANEIMRDGFSPEGCAVFTLCFDNGEGKGSMCVQVRVRDCETGECVPVRYAQLGAHLSEELFTRVLNSYVNNIKTCAQALKGEGI